MHCVTSSRRTEESVEHLKDLSVGTRSWENSTSAGNCEGGRGEFLVFNRHWPEIFVSSLQGSSSRTEMSPSSSQLRSPRS
jgi:hypothetical protein